jgi:hypothetical protein
MSRCLAVLGLAALFGCSESSEVAGGTTTDTENALAFVVVDTSGHPLVGARATLWPSNWVGDTGSSPALDSFPTAVSDAAGKVSWEIIPSGSWQLEIVAGVSGARVPVRIYDGGRIHLGRVEAPPLGGIVGRLGGWNPGPRNWVRLRGSSRVAPADSLGTFRLDGLPAGSWIVEGLLPASAKQPSPVLASVEPGERTSGVRLAVPAAPTASLDSLLLWNFERQMLAGTSYLCGTLGPLCGLWTPAQDTVRSGAWSGNSLRLLPERSNGFGLVDSGRYVDLSSMDSLSLMVRGPGRIRVTFHSRLVQDGEGSLCARINVSSGWQRLVLRDLEITPDPGSRSDSLGRTWREVRGAIERITFESRPYAGKSADTLLIDDLVMHGRKLDSLSSD